VEKGADKWRAQAGPVAGIVRKKRFSLGKSDHRQDERVCENTSVMVGNRLAFCRRPSFTYDPALPSGANIPFHQVTDADVWSDDPRLPITTACDDRSA